MEQLRNAAGMLDLMVRPAFSVKAGVIAAVNQSAENLLIREGSSIYELIHTGKDEYQEFREGCLYLTLLLEGQHFGASVTRFDDADVFVLEQEADQSELQAMALAARELREPLGSVMAVADHLFPLISEDKASQEQISHINRGLFQMLRIISNMSDASRYAQQSNPALEIREITSVLEELFQQAGELIEQAGIRLTFTNLREPVYTLVDEEKLERAVYNILSNAAKFTPKGGSITAVLTRRTNRLYLSVQDSGIGVDPKLRGSVYSRYLRQPGVEDGRFGIGLGMVLIRSAAAAHGGTVLMEHPTDCGARITMTLAINQDKRGNVRSTVLKVDYAGERSHGLIELSDSLPSKLYERDYIN